MKDRQNVLHLASAGGSCLLASFAVYSCFAECAEGGLYQRGGGEENLGGSLGRKGEGTDRALPGELSNGILFTPAAQE